MEALSNIGTFLSSGAGKGVLTAGTLGGGFLQNLLAARQANAKQKFVQDLITNPAKFQALVSQNEKPLSQGLTTDIARQADAYGAERGLGSSPAVMRDVYAQALAPAELQQQQAAQNAVLSLLSTYAGQPTMAPVNVTPMLQALSMWKPSADSTVPMVDPGVNVLQPSYMPGGGTLPAPIVSGANDFSGLLSYNPDTMGFGAGSPGS